MPLPTPLRLIDSPPEPVTLPHNLDAEQALLGALMIDNRLVEDVIMRLKPIHFFEPLHADIYAAILKLSGERNMIATPVTLRPLFESHPAMIDMGGPAYLATLTANSGALIAAKDFAKQIYDLALLRELIRVGREMATGAADTATDTPPLEQIETAELALYNVAEQGTATTTVKTFAAAATEAVTMADRAMKAGGGLSGYTTGLRALDAKIGGLHKSDLIILASRPAMGKTSLATNIAFSCAQRALRDRAEGKTAEQSSGTAVAFFSLEMSSDQLATRILAEQSEINSEKLRKGQIDNEDFTRLARAAADLSELPFYIDDTPALTIAALRTRARRLQRQADRKVGLIVVDYLQLLQGSSRAMNENRVNEISEITRGLKTLAKELQVPVLALSQLSRAVENREDKRPQLADLRESGTIEQDADIVMFIYREEYYHAMKEPEVSPDSPPAALEKASVWQMEQQRLHGLAEVIVAKQRHGSTGTVRLNFNSMFTKFSDRADEDYLPERRG